MQKQNRLSLEKGDLLPILLLLPTLFIVLVVLIIPLLYSVFMSFFDYRIGSVPGMDQFIGLTNYIRLFNDPVVWQSTRNTIAFSFLAITGDIVFGTLIAVLLLKLRTKLGGFMRAVYLTPLLVSPIIIGLIWKFMFDPTWGTIYWILGWFGLTVENFPGVTSSSTALFAVVIAHWWQVIPFVMLVVTAGLVSIPQELYEAAHMDGAGEFYKFFKISLPLLTKIYMVVLVIAGVDTLKVFDIIFALTGGGPANSTISLSMYAHSIAFRANDLGYAAVISNFTMIVTFLIFGILFIKFNRNQD